MPIRKRSARSYIPAFAKNADDDRSKLVARSMGTLSATLTRVIFCAPARCIVRNVSLVVDTAIAADGTDKWTFQVNNQTRGTADLLSAAKSTADTAISANTRYDLGADQGLTLADGDVLTVTATKGGSAGNLSNAVFFVEYEITGYETTTSTSTT